MIPEDFEDRSREDVAYHEAGHAVFAHHVDIGIVALRPGVQGGCETDDKDWPDPVPPERGPELAAFCLAGFYAEDRRRGAMKRLYKPFWVFKEEVEGEAREYGMDPAEIPGDEPQAYDLLRTAAAGQLSSCGDLEACYEVACEMAARNTSLRWNQIEAVAQRFLQVADIMDGNEIGSCIENAK